MVILRIFGARRYAQCLCADRQLRHWYAFVIILFVIIVQHSEVRMLLGCEYFFSDLLLLHYDISLKVVSL